jgi:hypothetical protein
MKKLSTDAKVVRSLLYLDIGGLAMKRNILRQRKTTIFIYDGYGLLF